MCVCICKGRSNVWSRLRGGGGGQAPPAAVQMHDPDADIDMEAATTRRDEMETNYQVVLDELVAAQADIMPKPLPLTLATSGQAHMMPLVIYCLEEMRLALAWVRRVCSSPRCGVAPSDRKPLVLAAFVELVLLRWLYRSQWHQHSTLLIADNVLVSRELAEQLGWCAESTMLRSALDFVALWQQQQQPELDMDATEFSALCAIVLMGSGDHDNERVSGERARYWNALVGHLDAQSPPSSCSTSLSSWSSSTDTSRYSLLCSLRDSLATHAAQIRAHNSATATEDTALTAITHYIQQADI